MIILIIHKGKWHLNCSNKRYKEQELKTFSLILLTIFTFDTFALNLSVCPDKNKKFIKKKLELIEKGRSDNMRKYLDSILNSSKKCSTSKKFKEYIIKTFNKSVRKRIKNKIKHIKYVSKFRDVNKEIDKIEYLQKKYVENFGIKAVTTKFSRLKGKLSIGKTNQEKRKISCTNIDLRDDVTGPVYDQFGTQWCFAFSAADLISQHIGKQVSRVHLATTYNRYNITKLFDRLKDKSQVMVEGGIQSFALAVARKKGICLERDSSSRAYEVGLQKRKYLRSTPVRKRGLKIKNDLKKQKELHKIIDLGLKPNAEKTERKAAFDALIELRDLREKDANDENGLYNEITFLERLFIDYHGTKYGKDKILEQIKSDHFEKGSGKICGVLGELLPKIKFNDFVDVLKSSTRYNFYNDIQNQKCDKYDVDYKIHDHIGLHKKVSVNLDKALDRGRVASIAYDTNIFRNRYHPQSIPISDHVSTIVGRSWNNSTKQCEYLLKNTRGENDFGDKGFKRIPEEELTQFTVNVTYISSK